MGLAPGFKASEQTRCSCTEDNDRVCSSLLGEGGMSGMRTGGPPRLEIASRSLWWWIGGSCLLHNMARANQCGGEPGFGAHMCV